MKKIMGPDGRNSPSPKKLFIKLSLYIYPIRNKFIILKKNLIML